MFPIIGYEENRINDISVMFVYILKLDTQYIHREDLCRK